MTGMRVEVKGLSKSYYKGGSKVRVFDDLNLTLEPGERVALVGPSGCGKSTLLHLLGMLDRPTSGSIRLGDRQISHMPDSKLHQMRNRNVGFVFQAHNLLNEHTALGNVMVPVRLAGGSKRVAKARATALLEAVGLGKRMLHRPGEMSGGEQQRVALARALVMGPSLILADEPTGNLDPATSTGVFELMLNLNHQLGSTLIVVTHSMTLAGQFKRVMRFHEGRFLEE